MIQLPEYITASDYHDSTAVQQIYVALSHQIFPVSCVDGWDLTNQHTSLWGSGKLWSSLILSTSTAAQAHGCKWYMSLTDAVAPCLLVHWQATTTYRSKQWHSTGLCLQAHRCTRSHAKLFLYFQYWKGTHICWCWTPELKWASFKQTKKR